MPASGEVSLKRIAPGDVLLDRSQEPARRLVVDRTTEDAVIVQGGEAIPWASAMAWAADDMDLYEQDMWEAE